MKASHRVVFRPAIAALALVACGSNESTADDTRSTRTTMGSGEMGSGEMAASGGRDVTMGSPGQGAGAGATTSQNDVPMAEDATDATTEAGGSMGDATMGGSEGPDAVERADPAAGETEAAGEASPGGGAGPMGEIAFEIQSSLASDEDSAAPTTVGIVTWQVDAAGITDARIEFGLDASYGMIAPVDLSEDGYRTLLLGMKPARTYHFRIVADDGTTTYASDDQQIETGAPNDVNPISGFNVANADANLPGFYVTSFARGDDEDFVFVFDQDGDVVWWYNLALANSGIMRARMSADAKSIWLVRESLQGAPLQRLTMDGLSVQTYDNVVASHDITAVTADVMAYLDYGESDCDSIFEIDSGGNVEEVFESTNVTGSAGGGITGCHGNAVRYSAREDAYTFSDLRQDVVATTRSGELLWKLADLVQGGNASWGGAQHGHQLLDDSIVIFANDGAPNGSAAIEYGLDGSLIREFESGGNATNFGDVQRQPNGNTVVTYASTQNIQVVDGDDNLVLEVDTTGMLGYTEFRESMYGLPLDTRM